MRGRWRPLLLAGLAALWLAVTWHETHKPLPVGAHVASAACPAAADDVALLTDLTSADAFGRPVVSQSIFDHVLGLVRGARRFVVLDYGALATAPADAGVTRHVVAELTDALLGLRRSQPQVAILLLTDRAGPGAGPERAPELELLRAAGVEVVAVDLERLREANLAYAAPWRLALKWWPAGGTAGERMRGFGYKADERRLVLADDGHGGLAAVLGSAGLREAESGWSNLAVRVRNGALESLLASELAIARLSGWRGDAAAFGAAARGLPVGCGAAAVDDDLRTGPGLRVQLLTEGAIRAELLGQLDAAPPGAGIDIAAYALADRAVIKALLNAARRGVTVRLILDPGETTASGGGLPNPPAATELVSRSGGTIRVRWFRTHGERFHGTLVLVRAPGSAWLTLGSARLTRRSLDDFNLDANLAVEMPDGAAPAQQALGWFDSLWSNRAAAGIEYTADFAVYADAAQSDYWLYRLLEAAGAAPF